MQLNIEQIVALQDYRDDAFVAHLLHDLKEGWPLAVIMVWKNLQGTYNIVDGHHRFEAMKLFGMKEIDVYVLADDENNLNDCEACISLVAKITDEVRATGEREKRLREALDACKDRGQEMLEVLIDIVNWAYSIHSDAYPIKEAREILAREDAMGGWNKTDG